MTATIIKRRQWWQIALALTLALLIKIYLDDTNHAEDVVAVTTVNDRHAEHQSEKNGEAQVLSLNQIKQSRTDDDNSDLFSTKSWYVPPPPVPPAPPPAPTAPPLPFTFMGKVQNPDGSQTLFLSDQKRVYLVHGGETLAKNYHVDGIEHGKLVLTYLPLNKKQYLNLAEAH